VPSLVAHLHSLAPTLHIYESVQTNITFRCEPSVKQQAERIAAACDETLLQVLRRALREYGRANAQFDLPRPARRRRR
jgi:hypothetical protein